MKRSPFALQAAAIGLVFTAACVAGSLFSSVPARAQITVRADIGKAPPPPRFVLRSRPHETYIASQRVYVVDDPRVGDNDCFRYRGDYWLFRDGYWYRARSWRSPFVVVEPRYVPTAFYQVPPTHWKHAPSGPPGLTKRGDDGPPGQMKRGDGPPGQEKKGIRGHDPRGGGRGKK